MSKLKALNTLADADVKSTQDDLKKLAADFNEIAKSSGFAAEGCRTVCEVQVIIGPDGRPQPTVVCRLICDF